MIHTSVLCYHLICIFVHDSSFRAGSVLPTMWFNRLQKGLVLTVITAGDAGEVLGELYGLFGWIIYTFDAACRPLAFLVRRIYSLRSRFKQSAATPRIWNGCRYAGPARSVSLCNVRRQRRQCRFAQHDFPELLADDALCDLCFHWRGDFVTADFWHRFRPFSWNVEQRTSHLAGYGLLRNLSIVVCIIFRASESQNMFIWDLPRRRRTIVDLAKKSGMWDGHGRSVRSWPY